MSYAAKGEKVFDWQSLECVPPLRRSDHRLKRFSSTSDKRAWNQCDEIRYRHLYDLMTGSKTCLTAHDCHKYVPLEDLIRILMAEKDELIKQLQEQIKSTNEGEGTGDKEGSGLAQGRRAGESDKNKANRMAGAVGYDGKSLLEEDMEGVGDKDGSKKRRAGVSEDSEELQTRVKGLTEELNSSRDMLRQAMHKLQNIDEIVNENKKLQCRLRCSEERIKFLEEKKRHLESELADLRSKSQIQIDLEKAKQMLCSVIQRREESTEMDETVLENLTYERDELQDKVKKLEKELEESKKKETEIEMLKKQSMSDSLDREEMSRENECYRKKLSSMKCLEKQIQELKKQGRALADKYGREAQKAAEQMSRMEQAAKELQALRNERDSLRRRVNELASYESQYNALQRKLQRVDAVISENEELNAKLMALQNLEKENEYLRCRLEEMKDMETNATEDKERIAQLQCAVAEQEEEMKDLLCQIERLTSGKPEEELERLKCELYEKNSKLKLCEEQLAEIPMLEAEIDELRMKLQCCCRELPERKRGENSYQKIEVRLPATSTGIRANYKSPKEKCASLLGTRYEEQVGSSSRAIVLESKPTTWSSKCTEMRDNMSCEEVQDLLQSSKGIITCVLEDMIEHKKEMEELEKCNKAMKMEINTLKEKIGSLDKDNLLQEINKLKDCLRNKDLEISKLRNKSSGAVNNDDIEILRQLNKEMKDELKGAEFSGSRVVQEELGQFQSSKEVSWSSTKRASLAEESEYCKALQRELKDLKLKIEALNKLTEELKKENELLRELQKPGPDFSKQLDEKCALENLISLLQAELDTFKGEKLSSECEALRNELKRVMDLNCDLRTLVNCYRQRLNLEKKSNELKGEAISGSRVMTSPPGLLLKSKEGEGSFENLLDKDLNDEEGSGAPGRGGPRGRKDGGGAPGSETEGSEALGGGVPGSGLPGSEGPGSGVPGSGVPGSEALGGGMPGSGAQDGGVPGSGVPGSGIPGSGVPGSELYGSGALEGVVPGSGVPGSGIPGSGVPGSGVPGSGVPGSGVPGSGALEGVVPGSGVPGSGIPGSGVPGSGVPGSGVPGSGIPGSGVPGSGVPGSGVPGSGVPGSGVPGSGVPGSGVPGSGVPGSGVPGSGVPGSGVPGSGVPGSGVPGSGVPGSGVYESGVPGSGVYESGVPGSGVPGSGVPGSGVPGSGVPGSGVPGSGVPGSGVYGSGVPGSGVPGSGVPGSGVPGSGVPGSGVPGSGVPGSGVPGSGVPGSGVPGSGVYGSGVPGSGVPGSGVPGSGVPGSGVPGSGVPGSGVPGSGVPGSGVPGSGVPGSAVAGGLETGKMLPEDCFKELERLRKENNDLKKQLGGKMSPEAGELAKLKEKLSNMEVENSGKLKKMMDQHQKELSNRDKNYNESLNSMKAGYETGIRKLADRHKQSVLRLQELHQDEVQEINSNYEAQLNTMQTQSEAAIKDIAQSSAAEIQNLVAKHKKEIGELRDSLTRSSKELDTLRKQKIPDDKDQKMQQARLAQAMRRTSMQKISAMKMKFDESKLKMEEETEDLKKKLKEQTKGSGVCECSFAKKRLRKDRDPSCPLDFNEVLEKILEEGLDSLSFNEIALVHRKTCCALEGIIMKSNSNPVLKLDPSINDTCPHTPLLEADKQQLLNRIFCLENEIIQKQKQTQDAIISMEVAIKRERCRLQEVKNLLENEQQKNSKLTLLLNSQTKFQSDLKKERDRRESEASMHQMLCQERAKQLDDEIKIKKCMEMEIAKLKSDVKYLCAALDAERGKYSTMTKDQVEMRRKLQQSLQQGARLGPQLENENKFKMHESPVQEHKHVRPMVRLPTAGNQTGFVQNPLEAKSAKERLNLDQIKEKKNKIKTKCKKHRK